jgi:hypothetical protein
MDSKGFKRPKLGNHNLFLGMGLLMYERPSVDISKANFASDSEASDDEAEGKGVAKELVHVPPTVVDEPMPLSFEPANPNTFKLMFVPGSKNSEGKKKDGETGDANKKGRRRRRIKYRTPTKCGLVNLKRLR